MTLNITPEDLKKRASCIRVAVFDVDGVFTNGQLIINDQGCMQRSFHVHDGQGMRLLHQYSIITAVITGGQSPSVRNRMQSLGVAYIYDGCSDKKEALKDLSEKTKIHYDQMSYMGDDWPDWPCLQCVGLSITVPCAPKSIRQNVHWVTTQHSGQGAVREVCDYLLQAQSIDPCSFFTEP